MQYEAKCSNGGGETATDGGYLWSSCTETVVSASAGEPITNITQIQAKAACESIGAHLITNAEWMSLARDIEQVASNWTGGAVGSGVLKRGNVGGTAEGNYDGANPEVGVTSDKAKLKLSNGQEIYHLSGNVYEWVDKTIPSQLNMEPSKSPFGTGEIKSITNWGNTGLSYFEVGAKDNNLDGTKGIGRIYYSSSDNTTRAFIRGGAWADTLFAGVFALLLDYSPSNSYKANGFRCAR